MIIHRAFYREAAQVTLAIAAVLLVLILLMSLTALLGRAARGEYSESIIPLMLGLQLLKKLDLLLGLALYLGILLTLGRWYRDNEMTVLAACGVGLPQLLRPVFLFALVFALAVGAVSLYFTPLASRQIEKVKSESPHRQEIGSVTPGTFMEAAGGQSIIYAAGVNPESGRLENIFVSNLKLGNQAVVVAGTAHAFTEAGTEHKYLALRNGTLYDGAPGEADYRIVDFEALNLRLRPKKAAAASVGIEGAPTWRLWARTDGDHAAELHWRLAKPVAVFVLAAFALVLAYTDPRRGRLTNLFAAILVYFIYSNLLGLGQTLIKKGVVPPALGLWWVHVGLALIAFYLFARRSANKPLLSLPARAR